MVFRDALVALSILAQTDPAPDSLTFYESLRPQYVALEQNSRATTGFPPPPPRSPAHLPPPPPPKPLDDPQLNAELNGLMAEYDALGNQGSIDLAHARNLIAELKKQPAGSKLWHKARDEVAGIGENRDSLAEIERKLRALNFRSTNASSSDKARLEYILESVSQSLCGTEKNYSYLLENLVNLQDMSIGR